MANNLVFRLLLGFKRKRNSSLVTLLNIKSVKINASSVNTARCARLKSAKRNVEFIKCFAEFVGREHSVRSALVCYITDVNSAAQKCTCCKDNGFCTKQSFKPCLNHPLVTVFVKVDDFALTNVEIVGEFKRVLHTCRVFTPVNLCTQRVNGRTFAEVEHSALERILVRRLAHFAAESVNFSDKVAFARSADRRIARHISDPVQIYCKHGGFYAEPCRCKCRFNSCVTCTDNYYIIFSAKIFHISPQLLSDTKFAENIINYFCCCLFAC